MIFINKKSVLVLFFVLILSGCSIENKGFTYQKTPIYEPQKSPNIVSSSNLNSNIIESNSPSGNGAAKQSNKEQSLGRKRVKVVKIYDGNTIQYKDLETGLINTGRLLGIDCPESKDKELFGKEVTEFLEDLILNKEIKIEGDPKAGITDKYGRYLIYAYLGKRSIQYLLIKEGLARVAYLFDDYKLTEQFKEAENIAKAAEVNIWSIPGYVDNQNGFNMGALKSKFYKNPLIDKSSEIIGRFLNWN